VARRVGGLNDTIIDGVTGFLFDDYTPAALDEALARALVLFEDRPELRERSRDAMHRDFSWTEPLAQYAAVYRRARARAAR
jgi:starch synthase